MLFTTASGPWCKTLPNFVVPAGEQSHPLIRCDDDVRNTEITSSNATHVPRNGRRSRSRAAQPAQARTECRSSTISPCGRVTGRYDKILSPLLLFLMNFGESRRRDRSLERRTHCGDARTRTGVVDLVHHLTADRCSLRMTARCSNLGELRLLSAAPWLGSVVSPPNSVVTTGSTSPLRLCPKLADSLGKSLRTTQE